MTNTKTTVETHIRDIRVGDLVLHDGEVRTVSGNNIGGDSFWGKTIFGDSYDCGRRSVIKVPHYGLWKLANEKAKEH